MNMSYKSIILFLIVLMPLFASAQRTGGHVIRPTKKQEQKPVKRVNQAKKQTMSKAERERILNNLINNMVYIEGGSFMMGSSVGADSVHQVTLSSFSIGKYEVTQDEWEAVMGSNPSRFKGAKRPVENVSWSYCRQFIRKLNSMTGKNFRMLTEAEWEYAARGGKKSRGYEYAGSYTVDDVGWYDSNSSSTSHDVGQLSPNELGLYDMSGNVWEWCSDWYDSYESGSQSNPSGPSSGFIRVKRGGSWFSGAGMCRVSHRSLESPNSGYDYLGLRLAL